MEGYPVASSKITDNKTTVSWKILAETLINNFKNKGFGFSLISQMYFTIIADKKYMTYDFHMKYKMEAIEWEFDNSFNKNRKLMNKFPQNWIHRLKRKFESCRD